MKISHIELAQYVPVPGNGGDILFQFAKGAKAAVCFLWGTYPGQFARTVLPGSYTDVVMNAMCEMPPTSQPPVLPSPPPYTGGQCTFRYDVFTRYVRLDPEPGPNPMVCNSSLDPLGSFAVPPFGGRGTFWGPIGGVTLTTPSTGLCEGFYNLNVLCHGLGSGTRNPNQINVVVPQLTPGDSALQSIDTIVVQPAAGSGPDTCGDLPVDYPVGNPPASQVFNIDISDSSTTIQVPITWDGDFNFPINFDFSGGKIGFDLGGISLNWYGDLKFSLLDVNPFPELPPIMLPPGFNPPGGGGPNPSPDDPDVIPKLPIPVTPTLPLEEMPGPEEEFIFARIDLTVIPPGNRYTIPYVNPADSVHFAGYVAFTRGASPGYQTGPEIPIRRTKTILKIPQGFDGVVARAINGFEFNVTIFTVANKKTP